MTKFLGHKPCPRCGSKDNLGDYTDHVFCFGCKYYKNKDDIHSIRSRVHKITTGTEDIMNVETITELPRKAMKWLLSYGISQEEIKEYNIQWSPKKELLVLLNTLNYWQGRCFGNSKIKYMSAGSKPFTIYGSGDTIVLVEDVLSAIKIARLHNEFCATPLLGSTLSYEFEKSILKEKFKKVYVWLDRDKAINAVKIKNKLKTRGVSSKAIITPLDPKEYSKGEILEWLKNK